jgi:hypothetical protein
MSSSKRVDLTLRQVFIRVCMYTGDTIITVVAYARAKSADTLPIFLLYTYRYSAVLTSGACSFDWFIMLWFCTPQGSTYILVKQPRVSAWGSKASVVPWDSISEKVISNLKRVNQFLKRYKCVWFVSRGKDRVPRRICTLIVNPLNQRQNLVKISGLVYLAAYLNKSSPPTLLLHLLLKPNSWTYNFVEVSEP